MSKALQAVSFDLWDTIIDDDSDEPKRQARGLRSKADERRFLVFEALGRHAPIALDEVRLAFDTADAAFNKAWKEDAITWPIAERLRLVLDGLGRTLPDEEFEALTDAVARMEVDLPPDTVGGITGAIETLSGDYKLCITSDAIVTPGRELRRLLAHHGLERHFQAFAFSDEIGRSKPDPAMFEAGAAALGVDLGAIVHVGDREHNDVRGPQALGMKAVLFTAARDADAATTSADAICPTAAELPAIIDRLAAGA